MVDDNVYLVHDPEVLRGLAFSLSGLANALNQLSSDVNTYSSDLGASQVVSEFSSIANNWWVERGKLVQEFNTASNALVAVAKQYANDESKIASAGTHRVKP
jgi:hypothetical protein